MGDDSRDRLTPDVDKRYHSDVGGILTSGDREFLRNGDEKLNKNAKDQKRSRIRKRFRNALWDFALLAEYWETDQLQKAISERGDPHEGRKVPPLLLRKSTSSMVDLMYRCRPNKDAFAEYCKMGIEQALREMGFLAGVRVEIETFDEQHISEFEADLEEHGAEALTRRGPDRVPAAALRLLYEQGRISREELAEYRVHLREHRSAELAGQYSEDGSGSGNGDDVDE